MNNLVKAHQLMYAKMKYTLDRGKPLSESVIVRLITEEVETIKYCEQVCLSKWNEVSNSEQFAFRISRRIKQYIEQYDGSQHDLGESNMFTMDEELCRVPFYFTRFGQFDTRRKLFQKLLSEDDFLDELIEKRPYFRVFRESFTLFLDFKKQFYVNNQATFHNGEQAFNLIDKLLKCYGFQTVKNEFLKDENGNVLVDANIALLCEEINLCVFFSNNELPKSLDLEQVDSPLNETEQEWGKFIFTSQIMQRRNSFRDSLCIVINNRQPIISIFSSFIERHHFLVCGLNPLNLNELDGLIMLSQIVWSFLLSAVSREELRLFPIDEVNLGRIRVDSSDYAFHRVLEQKRGEKLIDNCVTKAIVKQHKMELLKKTNQKSKVTQEIIEQLTKSNLNQ